jgi:hypothetical protein
MFNIGYIIPIVMSWHLLLSELIKYKKEEVGKNIMHFIHGLIFIVYHNYYNNNTDMIYATHISIGFYIYDFLYLTAYIIKFKDKISQHAPYIVHHMFTVIILYNSLYNIYFISILNGYYIFEMSNMMLYVSYHIHKEHNINKKLLFFITFIQLLWYSYFRTVKILFFCYSIKYQIFEQSAVLQTMLVIIFLMGLSWIYKLTIKNINNLRMYNNVIKT